MSPTSGTSATPSSSHNSDVNMSDAIETNNINVNKPDLYSGDRAKLDDWLMQWDLFFMFQGEKVPEKKRVTLVASYMRGQAFTWIKPFVQQYNQGDAPDDVDVWMGDFDEFKLKIRPVFGVSNEPTIARRDIQRIRQDHSAADYAAKFQQLAAHTDWDDTALMTMFRQGLKPKVKEELMRTGASTDTLDTLINTAIEIDVKLYELQRELRDDPRARVVLTDKRPPPRNPWRNNLNRGQRGGQYQSNSGQRIHNNTRSGYYGPAAMDLSNINKGPDRWNKKSKGSKPDKSQVTCYGCGKQGHFARDCRMKNKVVRQLNVLTTGDEGTGDEWEVLTDDMGCLEMDTESEEDSQGDSDADEQYDRSPTPHPNGNHDDIIITDTERYHAVETRREGKMIIVGNVHRGRFVKRGDKYFTMDNKPLLVVTLTPADKSHDQLVDRLRITGMDDDIDEVLPRTRETKEQRRMRRRELDQAKGINYSPRYQDNWCDKQLMSRAQESSNEDEEEFEEAEEYRDYEITRARAYLASDGAGLSGLNRQLANSRKTRAEWAELAFKEWEDDNCITQAELDLYNRHTPSRSEPDFRRSPAEQLIHSTMEYWQDVRNSRHAELEWRYCHHDACKAHYMAKVKAYWFPSQRHRCTQAWYTCEQIRCIEHLWDKRTKEHFPGITDPQEILVTQLVINGYCNNGDWEECLNAACKQHALAKECGGFKDTEPFLGPRLRAPGIDPSIPSGPIASSNSQSY